MGMNDILKYLMENSDERFKKQIQYIMDQLNRESPEEEDDAASDAYEVNIIIIFIIIILFIIILIIILIRKITI